MSSLLDAVMSYVSPAIAKAAADQLGESDSAVVRTVKGVAATIFAGLIGRSNDAAFLSTLMNTLSDAKLAGALHDIPALIGGGNLARNDPKDVAGKVIGQLFGDRTPNILNSISQLGNLKPGSASTLLGLAGPIVMGVLGKRVASDGLDAGGLTKLLSSQGDEIRAALPAGLSEILGLSKIADATPRVAAAAAPHVAPAAAAAATKTRAPAWLWAVPLVVGAGALGWLLLRGEGTEKIAASAPEIAVAAAPVEAATPAPSEAPILASIEMAPDMFSRDLGGLAVTGAAGGVEEKLIAFIDSGAAPCTDAQCWFTFDRLTFETGSARLDAAKSAEQIANIAAILKAFPGVQLKIGGYTDNTGSTDANMALSQARAEAVVAAVAAQGVDASRLAAEGYGPQFPLADNATEEGRARNRRIDVRVRERG